MIHVFDIVQFLVLLQTSISSLADDGVLKSTSSHNICSRSWELQNRDTLKEHILGRGYAPTQHILLLLFVFHICAFGVQHIVQCNCLGSV